MKKYIEIYDINSCLDDVNELYDGAYKWYFLEHIGKEIDVSNNKFPVMLNNIENYLVQQNEKIKNLEKQVLLMQNYFMCPSDITDASQYVTQDTTKQKK